MRVEGGGGERWVEGRAEEGGEGEEGRGEVRRGGGEVRGRRGVEGR